MPTLKYRDPDSGEWVDLTATMAQAEAEARYVKIDGDSTVTGELHVLEPTAPEHAATKEYVDRQMPTGTVVITWSAMSPDWLLCQGQAVSRTTYADLFAVIGTTYGVGDGSTTFTLPDLMARTVVGLNPNDASYDSQADAGGADTHTVSWGEMPNTSGWLQWHNAANRTAVYGVAGAFTGSNVIGQYSNPQYEYAGANSSGTFSFNYGGGGGSHTNLMPYAAMQYAIRV